MSSNMNAAFSRRGFMASAAAAAALAVLGGCAAAKTRWVHSKLPEDEWAGDIAACRKRARAKAYEGAADEMILSRESEETGTLSILDRAALERNQKGDVKKLTARCLRKRGYVPKKAR
ncbi:MAG: twin-arginine translocation signal domain-containing protein [Rhodospirillales bacterium]